MKLKRSQVGPICAVKGFIVNACCSLLVRYGISGTYTSEERDGQIIRKVTIIVTCISEVGNVYEVSYKVDVIQEADNIQHISNEHFEKWFGFYDRNIQRIVYLDGQKMVAYLPETRQLTYQSFKLTKL